MRLGSVVFFGVVVLVSMLPLLDKYGSRSGQTQTMGRNDSSAASLKGSLVEDKNVERTVPPTPIPFHEIDPLFENDVLKKQAVSSRMRLVFLVGLEGTGHHYMADVLDKLCKTAKTVPCPKMCPLGRIIYPDLSNPRTAYDYKIAREKLRGEMQNLAKQEETLPEGEAFMVGFGPCRFEIGLLSYPNFNGLDKTLQYVDLKIVAEEAERAGIDLRIIYLTRSARSIMVSNVMHNNYGDTFIMEARVLMANAAVMESFFHEIDPAFTTCLRYENITSKKQAERVSNFVAPTEYSVQHMKAVMISTVKSRSSSRGHTRFLRWQGHRDSGEWGRERPSMRWTDGGGGFGPSATAEDMSWRGRQAMGEELTEGQKMITMRLQEKLDRIEQDLCSL